MTVLLLLLVPPSFFFKDAQETKPPEKSAGPFLLDPPNEVFERIVPYVLEWYSCVPHILPEISELPTRVDDLLFFFTIRHSTF